MRLTRLTCFLQSGEDISLERFGLIVLFAVFFTGFYPVLVTEDIQDNLFTLQASAWLQGRWDITERGTDVAFHQGRLLVPFPPFPAVLLIPVVYLFGEDQTNPTYVAILLVGVCLILLRSILHKLGQKGAGMLWLVTALICGTGIWTETALSSGVWAFAHIVAVTAMLLALNEALGCGRGWLVGLCLGAAFLSRQLCIFGVLFFCVSLWTRQGDNRIRQFLNQAGLWAAVSFAVSFYLVCNWARFGDPWETGDTLIPVSGALKNRLEIYGLFHPAYIPTNLIWFFLQGFQIVFTGETYTMIGSVNPYGTSITFASPFLFLAFLGQWQGSLRWAAWLSIAIIFWTFMCYYNNGWVQLNTQRFSLDFLPLLVPLLAHGYQRVPQRVWKGLIIYSVGLNILSLFISFWLPYFR